MIRSKWSALTCKVVTVLSLVLVLGISPALAMTLQATDDSSTNQAQLNTNFGGNQAIFVRNIGSSGPRQGFVKFDLSAPSVDT